MIALENLTIESGDFRIEKLNLEVTAGSYTVLMGRSGAGKTTLLETLAGLLIPRSGTTLYSRPDPVHTSRHETPRSVPSLNVQDLTPAIPASCPALSFNSSIV